MAYNPNTGYFYGAAASTSLFEMDLANKTLVSTITAATACRAIAYDDDDNTFWGNNWDSPLTEFNPDGSATGRTMTVTSIYGAAYDYWSNPGTPTMWAFTSDGGTPVNTLVEYNMDGSLTGRTIDITTVPGYDAGIGCGLASYEDGNGAYLLANIQQDPNLIVKFYLASTVETYTVTFTVDDGTNPIEGATVNVDGDEMTTNASGVAVYMLADGNYNYTVNFGYCDTYSGTFTVAGGAVSVDVSMTCPQTYSVTVTVTDGTDPIIGANVVVTSLSVSEYTNINGIATFEAPVGTGYQLDITAAGYETYSTTFDIVDADVNINVVMDLMTYSVTFNVDMSQPITNGEFVVGTDIVYVTGSFAAWATPGDAGSLELTDADVNQIYSVTTTLGADSYEYKYFKNAGWGGGEWPGDPNRTFDVVDADVVLDDVWGPNAINELNANVTVSPNPTSGMIKISADQNFSVEVLDMTGRIIKSVNMNNNVANIDLSSEQSGMYIIRLTNEQGTATTKIIKN